MHVTATPEWAECFQQLGQLFEKDSVEAIARETKFVQRASTLTGPIFLITSPFAISQYANPTLEQLSSVLDQGLERFEEEIRREALHQRMHDDAAAFFEAMLAQAIRLNLAARATLKIVAQFAEVILVERTSCQVPAKLAHLFGGSGGRASPAAMNIRVGDDLTSGRFFSRIQEGKTPDTRNDHGIVDDVSPGSLRLSA